MQGEWLPQPGQRGRFGPASEPEPEADAPSPRAPCPTCRRLVNWETRRSTLVTAMVAEFIGVFFYVYAGIGASSAFFITAAVGEEG